MSSMAKSGNAKTGFMASLFQGGLYKPAQGRIVRQVTFVAAAILVLLIAWSIGNMAWLEGMFGGAKYVWFLALSVIGLWISYRAVNYAPFADFLIAVEAEMNKVSWPGWPELWKASLVVIFVIFAMALLLFVFDVIWSKLFELIGIRARP